MRRLLLLLVLVSRLLWPTLAQAGVVVSYDFEEGQIPNPETLMPNLVPTAVLTEGGGNDYLRETASPSDCGPSYNTVCPQTRAELWIGGWQTGVTSNATVQYNVRMRLPSTNPTSGHSGSVLWQLFQAAGFSRTIWIGISGSTPEHLHLYNEVATATGGPLLDLDLGPITYDTWHTYNIYVYLTDVPAQGRIDVVRDGTLVGSLTGQATVYNASVITDNYVNAVDFAGTLLVVDYDDVQLVTGTSPTATTPPAIPTGLTVQ